MQDEYNKLIWSIVNKLLAKTNDKYYYSGLEEDLFQEGYMGLIMAQQKYDTSKKDVKFTTFAYKYIYGYCLNYLKKEFVSLRNEDIDSSPALSSSCELDTYFDLDIIKEINNRLKKINQELNSTEEKILKDKIYKELSFEECANLNNCSKKKVINVINKYKSLIHDILINY